jgi:hypothetical protein
MKKPRLKHDEIGRRLLALGYKPSSPTVASERGAVDGRPAPPSEDFLYRYAKVASRVDSPSVADLIADGWSVEHTDPRYGTVHLRKNVANAQDVGRASRLWESQRTGHRKELPDALPRARGPRDRGDVDSLHAARDLVLSARSRETHLAAMGIAALLAALVLLGCAFLAVAAWNKLERAAQVDEVQVRLGER